MLSLQTTGTLEQPVIGSQESVVQASPSSQEIATFWQPLVLSQESRVQAFLSLQLGACVVQVPLVGIQYPKLQASTVGQDFLGKEQAPLMIAHVSSVHGSPSLHLEAQQEVPSLYELKMKRY